MAVPPLRSAMDRDARVAVRPLLDERQRQLQWLALVGFGHGSCAFGKYRGEEFGKGSPESRRRIIRRVDEDEVVRGLPVPQERQGVPLYDGRADVDELEVAADRGARARVAV